MIGGLIAGHGRVPSWAAEAMDRRCCCCRRSYCQPLGCCASDLVVCCVQWRRRPVDMGEGEGSPRRLCVLTGVVDQESPGLTTAPFNRCMHGPVCAPNCFLYERSITPIPSSSPAAHGACLRSLHILGYKCSHLHPETMHKGIEPKRKRIRFRLSVTSQHLACSMQLALRQLTYGSSESRGWMVMD